MLVIECKTNSFNWMLIHMMCIRWKAPTAKAHHPKQQKTKAQIKHLLHRKNTSKAFAATSAQPPTPNQFVPNSPTIQKWNFVSWLKSENSKQITDSATEMRYLEGVLDVEVYFNIWTQKLWVQLQKQTSILEQLFHYSLFPLESVLEFISEKFSPARIQNIYVPLLGALDINLSVSLNLFVSIAHLMCDIIKWWVGV